MNLSEFHTTFSSEEKCIAYLALQRWGDTPICPHCTGATSYTYASGKLFKCATCRKQYTVRVGTIFSESKLPLTQWFLAIYLATSLKKGISSTQLSRYLGVTQKTAWFMLQRIRYALEHSGSDAILSGTVEIDETYIGGKSENKAFKRVTNQDKAVVFGMVERSGKAKILHLKSAGARVLLPKIDAHIAKDSTIYSDQYRAYISLNSRGYIHSAVNHFKYFKDGDAHTNSIEGLWSHLKRGINGVYHQVSPKHLQKYCSEYEYRYNTRHMTDFERFTDWFGSSLCRLTYKELIGRHLA